MALNNSNPLSRPIIDFGLLTQDEDIAILREGIRSARRMYAAPVFKDRVFGTVLPAANVTRDEDLDMYIRKVAAPFLHAVGTAAMSPRNANWGVVNPNFRVKGTSGLRVVDASVIVSGVVPGFFDLSNNDVELCAQWALTGCCIWVRRARKRTDRYGVEVIREPKEPPPPLVNANSDPELSAWLVIGKNFLGIKLPSMNPTGLWGLIRDMYKTTGGCTCRSIQRWAHMHDKQS